MRENLYHPMDKDIPEYLRTDEQLRKVSTYLLNDNFSGGFSELWMERWNYERLGLPVPLYSVYGMNRKTTFSYSMDIFKDSEAEMAARVVLW